MRLGAYEREPDRRDQSEVQVKVRVSSSCLLHAISGILEARGLDQQTDNSSFPLD
jgi:hypothetical protein